MTDINKKRIDRYKKRDKKHVAIVGAILTLGICWYCQARYDRAVPRQLPHQTAGAVGLMQVKMPDSVDNTIIEYPGFTVSFNAKHHIPNYVAWELLDTETHGMQKRADKFEQDTDVEGSATPEDYRNSGYDRGHMAPAGDMKFDHRAMKACFMMTNIAPQAPDLNQKAWKKLEEATRKWARRDSALIVICGPVLTDRLTKTIGKTLVSVPQRYFKIIFAPFADPPRAIAFVMNNGNVDGGMQQAATTVDHIEALTGFDFFSTLPDDIENAIESQNNFVQWQRKTTR